MGDWREFLERMQEAALQPGAPAEEIAIAEQRLGMTLPPGYRSFLVTTNGFGPIGLFVRRLRPVGEIQWLRDEDPELIRIWAEATGDDALAKTLVVSDEEDGARVLLNPAVVDDEGEWEAWFFAHWVPSAEPYSSFRELLEETHSRFVDDEKARRGEPTPRVAPELGVAAEDLEGLVRCASPPQRPSGGARRSGEPPGTTPRFPPSLRFSRSRRKTRTFADPRVSAAARATLDRLESYDT
jgi:hypothetical protein